jgi:ABC-2 type transport system permease protein
MHRFARLMSVQLRSSVLLAAQYRLDFVLDFFIGIFWTVSAVLPLFIVYQGTAQASVPGWTFGETLLVVACFVALQAVIDGAISPSLSSVFDQVRSGSFDFTLLMMPRSWYPPLALKFGGRSASFTQAPSSLRPFTK